MPDYLRICEQAARAGGAVLLDWAGRWSAREKGPSDLVTDADLASQEAIRRLVYDHFPSHEFVGEEQAKELPVEAEYCWVVDPLDGTTNFVHGIPHFAVSVALLHFGRPVVGAVYDPVSRECYTAALGAGGRLNGQTLRTSAVTELSQAVIAASFSAKVDPASPEIDQFVQALLLCQGVRRTGSAALNLCYVAAGRFDAFWALTTKTWDVAAGILLVTEAGGIVTGLDGSALDLRAPHPVASANRTLHASFRELLLRASRPA